MSISKTDVIKEVAKQSGFSVTDSTKAVNTLVSVLTAMLKPVGAKITLTGFATLETKKRNSRSGVNPKTGEKIQIRARNTVTIKAGKLLKDAVN